MEACFAGQRTGYRGCIYIPAIEAALYGGAHSLVLLVRMDCLESAICTPLCAALVQHQWYYHRKNTYINMLGTSPAFRRAGLCRELVECIVSSSSGTVAAEAAHNSVWHRLGFISATPSEIDDEFEGFCTAVCSPPLTPPRLHATPLLDLGNGGSPVRPCLQTTAYEHREQGEACGQPLLLKDNSEEVIGNPVVITLSRKKAGRRKACASLALFADSVWLARGIRRSVLKRRRLGDQAADAECTMSCGEEQEQDDDDDDDDDDERWGRRRCDMWRGTPCGVPSAARAQQPRGRTWGAASHGESVGDHDDDAHSLEATAMAAARGCAGADTTAHPQLTQVRGSCGSCSPRHFMVLLRACVF